MDERADELVGRFLSRVPWRRAKASLVMPLVELLLDDAVAFWDVKYDRDPRSYAAIFVVFTRTRVVVHHVDHRRGDPRASLRTEVALRAELVSVTSAMTPETPYSWVERLCDWLVDHCRPVGRRADALCTWLARGSGWFERHCYSLDAVEPARARSVDVRYDRFSAPLTLPFQWNDRGGQRNTEFDRFLPELLDDLP